MLQYLFGSTALTYLFSVNTFTGTARNDFVFSSGLNDTINTGDGNDYVDSGAGNDVITLGNGNDIALAGNGDDRVDGGAGNDSINGGNGNDTLDGGTGDDTIEGGSGNDSITGGAGNDIINAGGGNDQVVYRADATAGRDRVNGGQGTDTLVLELTAAQQANPAFITERAAFSAYLAAGGTGTFTFQSIGLTVTGGFEQLRVDTIGGPPVNTAPVVSGAVTLPAGTEDTSTVITSAQLLANATDAEGNPLTVVNLQSTSGTVVANGNGTWTFTPAANANGPVSFTYSVSDGVLSTVASATLAVAAVNDGPVAGAAVVLPALAEDGSVTITAAQLLANATDIDSANLSVVNLQASSGTLINNGNGTYTYTPAANDDTAVTFTYQISDGQASVAGTASMDLTAVNDGPVAGAAIVLPALAEDGSVTITAAQLLANATDIDSANLSVVGLTASSGTLIANPDGTWTFTPAANDDTGVTFTYQISDGQASVAGTASMDLTAVNDGPVAGAAVVLPALAEDGTVTISAAQLLANATDIDGDSLSITGISASSGTLVANEDGSYSFIPALNDNSEVTFTYTISDGVAETTATATLDLTPVNDAPVAGAAVVLAPANEDTVVTITAAQLLANASDVDGDALSIVNLVASSGTLVQNEDGSYSFTPAPNDDTAVTFSYQISDGTALVDGTASLDLIPVNDLPVIEEESDVNVEMFRGNTFDGTIVATDVETPQAELTYELYNDEEAVTLGTVFLNADGTYTYYPPVSGEGEVEISDFVGEDSFKVLVRDADGGETIVTVNINVTIDPDQVNFISGNYNEEGGTLEGTAATDVFTFENFNPYELTSGTDAITNFTQGTDIISLLGESYTADDILASMVADETAGTFTYAISPTGAQITTSVALTVADIRRDVWGTDQNDVLEGGSGIDILSGYEGDDEMNGGAGDDLLVGGSGSDTMDGGAGADRFEIFTDQPGFDVITGFVSGEDKLAIYGNTSEPDASAFLASGVQNPDGTYTYGIGSLTSITINTQLTLNDVELNNINSGYVRVDGTSGDDISLSGTVFGDEIFGLAGNDTIAGLGGNDWINGGLGNDILTGGAGSDWFVLTQNNSGNDVITDFTIGEDLIGLDASDNVANFLESEVALNGTFTYSLSDGSSFTTNVQLTETSVYGLFPV